MFLMVLCIVCNEDTEPFDFAKLRLVVHRLLKKCEKRKDSLLQMR